MGSWVVSEKGFDCGDCIAAVAWAPDGEALAAVTLAGDLHIFDKSGRSIVQVPAHPVGALDVAWHEGAIATAGQDGHVRLWSPEGKATGNYRCAASWVARVRFSRDGLLAAAAGKHLHVWQGEEEVLHISRHAGTIADLCWRPDGKAVGTASYGAVQLFRIGEEEAYETLDWHGSILCMAWSPTARHIAAGTQEATVNFWKLPYRHGEQLQMSGYSSKVRELSWDASGRFLATGGSEMVTVWDVSGKGPAGTRPRQLEAHEARISALAFAGKGYMLASGCMGGLGCLWEVEKSSQRGIVDFGSEITAIAWAPDDTRIAWATQDGLLFLTTNTLDEIS